MPPHHHGAPATGARAGLWQRFAHARGPAVAGLAAPVLFWTVLVVLGRTQTGYNAFKSDISQLALGPNGWVQTANFVIFAALIVVFQGGVQRTVAPGRVWGTINGLAIACGLGLVAIAVLPTDRVGAWTVHGAIHLGVVGALAVLLPLNCLAAAAHLKPDRAWRGYAVFSVLAGAFTGALVVLLLLVWSGLWRASHPWLGLYERIAFAVPCAWMEVIAIRLLRLS